MRKSAAARKQSTSRAKEDEQLYLVRRSENGRHSTARGFRHHRRKGSCDDLETPVVRDPGNAQINYSDNERGAINKLLALNGYYRSHPWPVPFDSTQHILHLGDARNLSWIEDESVHL